MSTHDELKAGIEIVNLALKAGIELQKTGSTPHPERAEATSLNTFVDNPQSIGG